MSKLFINISDISAYTGFDGNIDNNSIEPFIFMAQNRDIKRVLGTPLYEKMRADFSNNVGFTAIYAEIFKQIVIIQSYYSAYYHYSLGLAKTSQNGTYYLTPEKTERVSEEKAKEMSQIYQGIASSLEADLIAYLETVTIPEWVVKTKAKSLLNIFKL